jgi:hypothetical protein
VSLDHGRVFDARPDSCSTPPAPSVDEKLDEALEATFPASDPFDLSHANRPQFASPPCLRHEVDPTDLGYLSPSLVIALLNELLEGERAGARGLVEIAGEGTDPSDSGVLRDIGLDEARFCAMLARHITRLGGTPSRETGMFYGKLLALENFPERIALLGRGQAWVVRKLEGVLARIGDYGLHRDLKDMLAVHQRNIQRCKRLR